MHNVIDCTATEGVTFTSRFSLVAELVARFLTLATGRFHDVEVL